MEIMEKLDYKKQFKELYMPSAKPALVNVPEMIFFAVRGSGDPNKSADYKSALELLYAMSFTVKMSKMNGTQPQGYFEYVVPPLEGLWYQEGIDGIDYSRKEDFQWISMIRQPEFVTEEVFENARAAVQKKKPHLDTSEVQLMKWCEGLCVQLMHTGTYDDEPASIEKLHRFAEENGFEEDFSEGRYHHEIYLSDPRKCAPQRLKTVIRHPVKLRG